MKPYGAASSTRSEAERWLSIAEKLLAGRDIVGSKTFAIRARESDPRLDAAGQILAVVDTLIAAEKRINDQHDWYAILRLPRRTSDAELVADQYRRLAIVLNPHRNRLAFADQAFKLVADAWSVLSDPSKKSVYDNEITPSANIDSAATRDGQEHHEQEGHRHKQQRHQHAVMERQIHRNSDANKKRHVIEERELHNNQDNNSTIWTACPYCYNMYEYPRVYQDCSLRCQNCHRAFQAVSIPAPPVNLQGEGALLSCWGFFPIGVSASNLDKNKSGLLNWNPFSPMFPCPQFMDRRNATDQNVNVGGQRNVNTPKSSSRRASVDDEDFIVEISESSEESSDDWWSTRLKKKAKSVKSKGSVAANAKKNQGQKANNVKRDGGDNVQAVMGAKGASNAETSRKVAPHSAKKHQGKIPKEQGRLDLNVEFSNEVEEPASRLSKGRGADNSEVDGIEGNGLFEGLDEFLSNMPILNAVRDDKLKAG